MLNERLLISELKICSDNNKKGIKMMVCAVSEQSFFLSITMITALASKVDSRSCSVERANDIFRRTFLYFTSPFSVFAFNGEIGKANKG